MRTLTKQELDQILDNHKLWLSSGGKKGAIAGVVYSIDELKELLNKC